MIAFENASLSYDGKPVLDRVTFRAAPGDHIALMGPSGCGKTSLLQLAAGLARPTSGTVVSHARRLAYAFQEPRLMPWLTAAENVTAVLEGDGARDRAMHWLDALGLADAADKLPRQLSGGMAQRVNLARALAYEGDLLLLDEPLKELDEALQEDVLALLETYAAGRTVLVTTHDPRVARALGQRTYTCRHGSFLLTDP